MKQKSRLTSQAANLGYEIPALLYSPLKPTRTLIAKAIGREKIPLAKVVDFELLGALLGPGAPGADLAPIRLRWQAWKHEKY